MRCSAFPSADGFRRIRSSTCQLLLSSGREAGYVEDLQLDPVGIEEKHCVIPRHVAVFLRLAFDFGSLVPEPDGPLVDPRAGGGLEGEVMEADAVAVVRALARGLCFTQADRASGAADVPDRLATLPLDLTDAVKAERAEEVAVERQAALDRGHDEIDVVNARGAHVAAAAKFRAARALPAKSLASCTCSTTTWSRATCARSRRAIWRGSASGSSGVTAGSARSRCTTRPGSRGRSSRRWASGTA